MRSSLFSDMMSRRQACRFRCEHPETKLEGQRDRWSSRHIQCERSSSATTLEQKGCSFNSGPGTFLWGVCRFYLCLRGFSPGSLASFWSPKKKTTCPRCKNWTNYTVFLHFADKKNIHWYFLARRCINWVMANPLQHPLLATQSMTTPSSPNVKKQSDVRSCKTKMSLLTL